METLRKIAKPGNLFLNPDQLRWLGVEIGEYVIVKDDNGKHGHFISIFQPTTEEQLKLVEENNQE